MGKRVVKFEKNNKVLIAYKDGVKNNICININ